MDLEKTARIQTRDKQQGVVLVDKARDDMALLQMENGQRVWIPKTYLQKRSNGSYYLPLDLKDILSQGVDNDSDHQTIRIVPIVQEELVVEKQKRETGRVRVHKQVNTRQETIDEPGYIEEVSFERVPINEIIDAPRTAHYEGNTFVIPLIEEELVVTKRLVLREELRITKKRKLFRSKQNVTLRKEDVTIDRISNK